jgi:hypothetical protein
MLPIYIRWLQALMIFLIWLIVSLFLSPLNPILGVLLYAIEIFGLAMFCKYASLICCLFTL